MCGKWATCEMKRKGQRKKCEKIKVSDKEGPGQAGIIVRDQLWDVEILLFPLEH